MQLLLEALTPPSMQTSRHAAVLSLERRWVPSTALLCCHTALQGVAEQAVSQGTCLFSKGVRSMEVQCSSTA